MEKLSEGEIIRGKVGKEEELGEERSWEMETGKGD
jgi:hypothetical protein